MKHLMKIIILLVAFATSNVVMAAKVSEFTAKNMAFNVVKNVDSRVTSSSLSLVYTSVQANQTLMYVFGYTHGFVIIAADDRVIPVIGYSTENAFIVPKNITDTIMGNNFWGMMKNYEDQIFYVLDNNISATEDIRAQWSTLITGQSPRSMTTVVNPLLTTTWNQDWPYNSMCPVDAAGPGGHVYAGCVATAMAQILKYHNYPSQGLGSYGYQWAGYPQTTANFGATTYNWGNMPNSISVVNADVATLIYQTAVSCRSMWGAGSTGVGYLNNEDPMTRALPNYFKYAFSTIQYVDKGSYTDVQWNTLIQGELLANRPVYYRGDGSISHAFVCDGVNASNLYHFNWGWGGSYNGYFALSNLNPGGNNLSNNQAAIIGIKPNDGSTLVVNTTWSGNVTKSTHIAVPDAITLTVNAGALVKFAQNCKLQVWGRILSTGTSSNYATFTAIDTTTGWWGIKFDNNYMNFEVMLDNDTSKFIYSQVQYSDMRGITIKNFSKVLIDHSKINNNYIDGDEYGYGTGHAAGVLVTYSGVNIYHSEFYKNHATIYGGGLLVAGDGTSLATISGNDIYQNTSDGKGGGFYLSHTATFSENLVHHNQAGSGAGGALIGGVGVGNMFIVNNKLCNNNASSSGGGLYLENCNANIIDNLIANNSSVGGGGMLIGTNSNSMLLNNTLTNNYALNGGGGTNIVINSNPIFKNCIFFGNVSPGVGNQVAINTSDSDPFFDHCDIQGGLAGFGGAGSGSNYTTTNYTNNIDLLPQFVSPTAGTGNGYNGLTADWSLQSTSPCVNTADSTGVSNLLPPLDLGGNPRFNGILDMGAYEFTSTNPVVTTTGTSGVTSTSATLEGYVSSTNEDINLFFDWGLTTAYGNTVAATPASVIVQTMSAFTADIGSLTPAATYHFRAHGVSATSGLVVYGSDISFTATAVVKILNIKAFLEILYAGGGVMNQAMDESGPHFGPGIADQVIVELHNDASYPTIEYSSGLVDLTTTGNVSISTIPAGLSGSYYITIKHRNSIETTTALPVSFVGGTTDYDFTTAATQAYGDNLKLTGSKYVIWGGDVNQDGIVDSGDMSPVENASIAFTFGYVVEDVNGDGIVDSGDMNIVENNSVALVSAIIP